MEKIIAEAKELDKKYNFFVTINENFKGKPIAVKDNICTLGIQTTAGSKILKGYVPPFDATVIQRLKAKGFGIVGKTTMDEFGFGTFSANTFKIPKNPHDPTRACGGSSGGSAGYVAASKLCDVALGQSTGGSISAPASFCGVVGLTPTYGLVSRYGLIDYANSLDKIGAIAKTVEGAASILEIIAGNDPRDATTVPAAKKNYAAALKKSVRGMTLGIPKEYFGQAVDKKVAKTVLAAIEKLKQAGAKITEVSLPSTKFVVPAYYIIATAEASTNLAKFSGMRYGLHEKVEGTYQEYFARVRAKGFGEEAKRRILLGTYARMAGYRDKYYLRSLKVRRLVIDDFKRCFKTCDALVAPTMPMIAPRFSEIEKLTPVQQYMIDILTVGPNLAGLPHLSVPAGRVDGMPVGLHIIGDHLQEGKILRVGNAFEKVSK